MSDIGRFSPEFLESFRQKSDPIADKVIEQILEKENLGVLRVLFETLATNEITVDSDFDIFNERIRPDIQAYFVNTRGIPVWADRSLFEKATAVFQMFGPEILCILVAYSLPSAYSCANGAKVLYQTGRLEKHDGSIDSVTRRLVETTQFVINVLSPNALLGENKNGLVSIQKIRLIHATIRYYMVNNSEGFEQANNFDVAKYGQPINQEDLAGTMLSFSVIILRGLEKFGIELSEKQKEAFVHYWSVIGSLMGINDELIPANHAEAEQLTNAILAHQRAYSQEGHDLTMSCVSFMEHQVPIKRFEDVPLALVYFFCEDDGIPALLKLPPSDDKIKLIGSNFFKRYEEKKEKRDKRVLIRYVAGLFSRELIESFMRFFNEGKKVQFNLPSSLTDYGRPIKYRKKLPVGDELTSIDQAIYFLQEITDYFKSCNDPMGLFSAIYLLSTRMVKAGLENNEFKTPGLMHQVDLAFVDRYFTAINHYLNGTEPTAPWQVAIQCARRKDMFVDQYIFNGANAHIVFDLGIAVASVCPGEKIEEFKDDFMKMNEVFSTMYYQMNMDVATIWGPFAFLMKWAGNAIMKFENKVMDESREGAWERAQRIAKAGKNQPEIISQYSKHAVQVGKEIINPGFIKSLILRHMAKKEVGSVADKIDVMLMTDYLNPINK